MSSSRSHQEFERFVHKTHYEADRTGLLRVRNVRLLVLAGGMSMSHAY